MAHDEGVAHVAFMPFENQPEVDEVDVVLAQPYRFGAFAVGLGGVAADADDHRVPQSLHPQRAEHLSRFGLGFLFADAGPHALADPLQRGPGLLARMEHVSRVKTGADGFPGKNGGHEGQRS